MKKLFLILFFLIQCSIFGFAQSSDNSAPVKWEKYKISKDKIEIMFPKLPVRLEWSDICKQLVTNSYYAYAGEVVYEFKVFKKSETGIPGSCLEPEKFSDKTFTDYLEQLKAGSNSGDFQNVERGEYKFIKLEKQNDYSKYSLWLLNDFINNRWFEFNITSRTGKKTKELQFIESLKLEIDSGSIELFDGAEKVLGDENISAENISKENEVLKDKKISEDESPLTIITKPRPKYTDVARESNTIGSVRLRITFLRNGAIGNITVIEGVANGLTEQAIISAQKMAFLPMKRNGQNVTVVKVVVYKFTIF